MHIYHCSNADILKACKSLFFQKIDHKLAQKLNSLLKINNIKTIEMYETFFIFFYIIVSSIF